jgi:hypothetical protein
VPAQSENTAVKQYFLVQIFCFWTLSIVLSLSKNTSVYFSKHVSETGFCLLEKPAQLCPIDIPPDTRASPKMGVYKPNRAQTICESKENIKLLKLHTYDEALHQRGMSTEIITGEKQYSLRLTTQEKLICVADFFRVLDGQVSTTHCM